MSQKQTIEIRLRSLGSVSDVWAKENSIWRLAAIINTLRKEGWKIDTEYDTFQGKKAKTATYVLQGLPRQSGDKTLQRSDNEKRQEETTEDTKQQGFQWQYAPKEKKEISKYR